MVELLMLLILANFLMQPAIPVETYCYDDTYLIEPETSAIIANNSQGDMPTEIVKEIAEDAVYQSEQQEIEQQSNTPQQQTITKSGGVYYFNGITETYYSSKVLHHYRTDEWYTDELGFYHDPNGYYVVASDLYPEGTVIDVSMGKGIVLDCGCSGIDYYVCW